MIDMDIKQKPTALFLFYWIWFPIKAATTPGMHFNSASGVFQHFYDGINGGETQQASEAYCWIISILFRAWVFYGYDASAHLAEETLQALEVVVKGIWIGTFSAWILSVPTLIIILFCLQDFEGIISAIYANSWGEYLVQVVGKKGAVAILGMLWVDSTCATVSCLLSAQRVTHAISRYHVLPFSSFFRKLSKRKMAVNAAWLVYFLSVAITCAVIGSTVAFSAITAIATIATNASYLFPIIARHTAARKTFVPAKWNLGRFSLPLAVVASVYINFLFVVLLLPQLYPVTAQKLNYAPICIGAITIVSVVGWMIPKWGGRLWLKGPIKTITDEEFRFARVVRYGRASLDEGRAAMLNASYGGRKVE